MPPMTRRQNDDEQPRRPQRRERFSTALRKMDDRHKELERCSGVPHPMTFDKMMRDWLARADLARKGGR